ncbi:thiaminase II [Lactobacillus bombicola]|uniref:Aminopyrimidine aminohydrolase n=1 Tax=Lactobacillus bombicola TaxID=1505723 RepID=A0A396SSJ2_9LACO|nr:thiaminase II [Lactobacillus bombicola]RHW54872.1 thiaminase II [Lactobacillus bombicola]
MSFTQQLHQVAQNIWQKSLVHPFITELQSGQLPLTKFRFYLLQDRYYLVEFSKFHHLLAEQADNPQIKKFLLQSEADLRACEWSVRSDFFTELKITPMEIRQTAVAPTAYNYVNHMYLTLERDGFAPAIAAIVPCYWLYQEIGQKLAKVGSPVALYQTWIDTYDSDWYEVNVTHILQLINILASQATATDRQMMQTAFIRSSYYELQFWQMAYAKERWQ